MLQAALAAFATTDVAAARGLAAADGELDAHYRTVITDLASRAGNEAAVASHLADLLSVAHALERVGDRATNIGERVVYMATGEVINLNP
jgi:phosphate transport system protein